MIARETQTRQNLAEIEVRGAVLERTQTLAVGTPYCDFRFKRMPRGPLYPPKTQRLEVFMKLRRWLMCGAMLVLPALAQSPNYWPTQGWRTAPPEEQNFDSMKLAEGLQLMRQRGLDIHSFLLVHNGYVVVDANFYPYDGKTVHEVASVTKSLMTTLIGIAADQGKLKLDDPMLSFFPGRTIANRDARKEKITVRHLVTMSSGLDCTAANDEQTLREMRPTQDWVQFALDRKVAWEPGTQFVYCSPAIHLLSPILQKATGMSALEFVQQYLFGPLGIREVKWATDPQGYNRGSEGAYLHPHDMAKLGYLWLNKGLWEGKQIVSRQWVEDSIKPHMKTGDDDYGYGWWIATDEPAAYNAVGRGGQRIIVVPGLNLILVTTGGGYNFTQIEPWLRSALADISKTLPANPEGLAKLKTAVSAVVQPPAPKTVVLPQIAKTISGKTIAFGPNPFDWESMTLVFNNTAEFTLNLKLKGGEVVHWPVALDGVYRFFAGQYGLPMGLRATWADPNTLAVEYDNIANNDHALLRFRFEGNRVMAQVQETDHEGSATLEGRIVNP
jgi:CubicO group peptidase (beta-lactamase class C family)